MSKRRLEIDIVVDERGGTRGFTRMGRQVDTLESRMRRMGATGARVLGGAVVASAAAAAYGIKKSVEEAREANKVGAQTGAVIKSTGAAANVTERQVAALAGAISLKAGMDDEAIQKGANLLLTFKNIRNEAGQNNDIFNQSTQTIVDMSVALDQDLKSSAIQVGKALNDPIKGLTALQRVGVSFSEQKAEQIKQWVEEGNVLRAQKAILRELNSEFGGSAAAQADSFDKLKVAWENAQESIGQVFLPMLSEAADELTQEFMPRVERAGGALERIFNRKDLTLEGKFKRAGKVIEREFGDIPPAIADAVEDAVPIVASRAGRIGVAAAKGTVEGFIEADAWGKLAIAGLLMAKFGGRGAFVALGRQMGAATGFGMASSTVATARGGIAAKFAKTPVVVPIALALVGIPFLQELEDQMKDALGESTFDSIFPDFSDHLDAFRKDTEFGFLSVSKSAKKAIRETNQAVRGRDPLGLGRAGRRSWEELEQVTNQKGRKVRRDTVNELERMARQGGQKADAFQRNVGGAFADLDTDVGSALGSIIDNTNRALQSLGAKAAIKGFAVKHPDFVYDTSPVPGRARGGAIDRPMIIAGEEAPRHHEWMIATNPAYRRDNIGYWIQAGRDLGVPGFAKGGEITEPHLTGPEPLRSGGQAGIHKTFEAAQAYMKAHRPKPQAGSVAGYVGPPPSFKQLGDNEWVDSHTMQVAQWLSSKFGVPITDGWRPQNASYGAANSSHKRGTPGNPGAIDFGPSYPLLNFAKKHVAGLTEAMVHDAGFGLHTHLAFFAKGGKINWSSLVGSSWDNDELATLAHIVGMSNPGYMAQIAQGESSGNAKAVGQDPGGTEGLGLWQITTGYNDELIAKYGGREAMFNPLLNAKAAKEILDSQGAGAWYAPPTGPRGEVDGGLAEKFRALMGGEDPDSAPASKSQKRTLRTLRHRASGVVREAQKLKKEYEELGGTKRGKRALQRSLKLAKDAARKVKAGDREGAEKLIDKARDLIGKSRDSLGQAKEGVFTPGLKPGKLPALGTTVFDPAQDFSLENLPGLGGLPPEIRKLLKSPGLNWSGRYSVLESALTTAGLTDTKVDDASALNAMLGMDRAKRKNLKRRLAELNKRLAKGGLTKKQRAGLVEKRNQVLQGLGEVGGHIDSIQGQIGGLNEEGESEADTALREAIEAQTRAEEERKQAEEERKRTEEEHTAAIKDLEKEMKANREVAESEVAVGLREARRAIADMISGELGPLTDHQRQVAGTGSVAWGT